MRYVGLDGHARRSTFCVLDGNGRHLRTHSMRGPWDKVLAELAPIKRPFAVCFEASSGYGYLYTTPVHSETLLRIIFSIALQLGKRSNK